MSTNTLLKAARLLSFGTGCAYAFVGQTKLFGALLTGQGAVQLGGAGIRMDEALHQAAATVPAAAVGTGPAEFVIGIAFILVGFLLHGLIGVREEHERSVKITVAPKKAAKKDKWYWVEIRV
jgi:hypothetical protein